MKLVGMGRVHFRTVMQVRRVDEEAALAMEEGPTSTQWGAARFTLGVVNQSVFHTI